jgi:ankyrin repeat protein
MLYAGRVSGCVSPHHISFLPLPPERHSKPLCRTTLLSIRGLTPALCPQVVRHLLDHGGRVNCRSAFGRTALWCASCGGHTALVDLLLSRGADPWLVQDTGWTPLMAAAFQGHAPATRRLLLHKV